MTRSSWSGDDGILCCDVGQERFAFRSRDVRHIERAEYMRPDRGEFGRLGSLKLGGQQVPVYGLGDVLGRATRDDRVNPCDGHIAITGDRHSLSGWLIDRIARAAQPAPGDIAPLPPIIGAQAASWFEGIVWLGEDESALLLAPHRLTAPVTVTETHEADAAFERPRASGVAEPESVAVVFSTTALPSSVSSRYALSGRQIAAIVQPTPPINVPGCRDYVGGVTWWRRTAVPVIDFRAPEDRRVTTHRRRLIAQCGSRQHSSLVALSIDSEIFMCRPASEHRLLPEAACPPFAAGVFDVNGHAVALLDLDALLANEGHAAAR